MVADPLSSPQPAVLVRRHGTYSWGAGELFPLAFSPLPALVFATFLAESPLKPSLTLLPSLGADWEKAKGQAECLDYLLEVAVKMKLAGMEVEGMEQ